MNPKDIFRADLSYGASFSGTMRSRKSGLITAQRNDALEQLRCIRPHRTARLAEHRTGLDTSRTEFSQFGSDSAGGANYAFTKKEGLYALQRGLGWTIRFILTGDSARSPVRLPWFSPKI